MVAYDQLTDLDKFILHKVWETSREVINNYENYLFYRSTRLIHDFCNNWLSSFYFNILKDRLYVLAEDSHERRSSQTVLTSIGEVILKLIAPILSHTAEEAWQVLISEHEQDYPESIFLDRFSEIPEQWNNPAVNLEWEKIVNLRNIVLKSIEEAKGKGIVKDPLESEVIIKASKKEITDFLKSRINELKEYFIVSRVDVVEEKISEGMDFLDGKIEVSVTRAAGDKCVRCWLVSEAVGQHKDHPLLCERCIGIVK
jgi:isoleucyl-tRNA synthetase